jgi:hypothetical protein
MIVQVARQDGRNAVFDVPAQIKDTAPTDPEIEVVLTMNPAVTASGRVREVAPRADPVTGTFEVKVGLADPPAPMRLGSTVTPCLGGSDHRRDAARSDRRVPQWRPRPVDAWAAGLSCQPPPDGPAQDEVRAVGVTQEGPLLTTSS